MKNVDHKATDVTPSEPQSEEGPIETRRLIMAGGTVALLLIALIILKFVFKVF